MQRLSANYLSAISQGGSAARGQTPRMQTSTAAEGSGIAWEAPKDVDRSHFQSPAISPTPAPAREISIWCTNGNSEQIHLRTKACELQWSPLRKHLALGD